MAYLGLLLVLSSAHSNPVRRQVHEISSGHAGIARRTQSRAKLAKTGQSGCSDELRSGTMDSTASDGEWAGVVPSGLELQVGLFVK